jgi:hypothetical protein
LWKRVPKAGHSLGGDGSKHLKQRGSASHPFFRSRAVDSVKNSTAAHPQRMETTMISPLYSVEMLSGVATQMDNTGAISPFTGTAVLWIRDPVGTTTQNNVTCSAPNGAWKYFNSNNKAGTWTATIHVPGTVATASLDYEWEVDSSIATAQ